MLVKEGGLKVCRRGFEQIEEFLDDGFFRVEEEEEGSIESWHAGNGGEEIYREGDRLSSGLTLKIVVEVKKLIRKANLDKMEQGGANLDEKFRQLRGEESS